MVDAAANEPRLTGTVPLYKNVEPLNRQKHAKYGVNTVTQPFNFLKDWHFVPAISAEFPLACGSYPIIFLGEKKMPILVMGLRQGSNVFVSADGQFDSEHYMPAYVRRYPFVSAANPNDQPSTVCVDLDAEFVVTENSERPFFDANGEPTEYTRQAIDFVSAFENDARATEAFVERLVALDLLEKKDVKVSNPDDPENPVTVAEYFGVSSEKFDALPAAKLKELQSNGDLAHIISHMISLQRWDRILRRTSNLAAAQAPVQA
ncbi:SapC family protein [Maricaulis sp.]|uniref:SapC family protein n=1 Tax=Maricaulis sp. TaxID=1486257 RepID=UPI0025B84261|nr:SapC family protein [Maricaulis sp.]